MGYNDDNADEALAAVLPHLGALGPVETVDGKHSGEHRGHTFDRAARRRSGQWVAIEVGRAWDEEFLGSDEAWRKRSEAIADEVRRLGLNRGAYMLTPPTKTAGRASAADVAGLAQTIVSLSKQPFAPEARREYVHAHGMMVGRFSDDEPLKIVVVPQPPGEWEGGPESVERFRRVVDGNTPKLERAGRDGYETHLLVVHWLLGSTGTWREWLRTHPPVSHPQFIWAVDLNVRVGTQDRAPAELIFGDAAALN
jgi:hypothetical protein